MHDGPCVYLHVFVFDLLTCGDAVGDVEMDELRRKIYCCRQPTFQHTHHVMSASKGIFMAKN